MLGPIADNLPKGPAQTIGVAIIGGTVSRMGGGRFANGAIAAAFVNLFNDQGEQENNAEDAGQKILDAAEEMYNEGAGFAQNDRVDNFPEGSCKCGKFVHDAIRKAGYDAPMLPGGEWPYRPEQWGGNPPVFNGLQK